MSTLLHVLTWCALVICLGVLTVFPLKHQDLRQTPTQLYKTARTGSLKVPMLIKIATAMAAILLLVLIFS